VSSRIKIKVGAIEVEYEGEEKFIKDELPGLIKIVAVLHEQTGATLAEKDVEKGVEKKGGDEKTGKGKASLSTSSIATKLACKTGPDLVIAACAHLSLVKSQPQFTRSEIATEMKTATAFFNRNFISNLTKSLKNLVVADKINEVGTDTYALSDTEVRNLKTQLGL
jgi:hypothetical protein